MTVDFYIKMFDTTNNLTNSSIDEGTLNIFAGQMSESIVGCDTTRKNVEVECL